jgi:molecular chaperone GrpE
MDTNDAKLKKAQDENRSADFEVSDIEPTDEEGTASSANQKMKDLREKLKKCEAEKQEYLTGWQRTKADMINARKRDEEDKKSFIKFANERLIDELVPVLESFDLAMGNKEAWEKADKNWRTGVEYIYSQLKKALTDNGLEEIAPAVGDKFNHDLHEAVSHEESKGGQPAHTIVALIQKGYKLNGKILRPSKVKVGAMKD